MDKLNQNMEDVNKSTEKLSDNLDKAITPPKAPKHLTNREICKSILFVRRNESKMRNLLIYNTNDLGKIIRIMQKINRIVEKKATHN